MDLPFELEMSAEDLFKKLGTVLSSKVSSKVLTK
jgi:hypothetical protein